MIKTNKSINRFTVFDHIDIICLFIIGFISIYPFWNILMISLNEPQDTLKGGITLWFRKFSFANYIFFVNQKTFSYAFIISVLRTVIGAPLSVFVSAAFAYCVSKKWLIGRKYFLALMIIPMYIQGGLIPTFLNILNLGLYQNFLVYILPNLLSPFYVIILMTNFKSIPIELEESVRIDGGNDLIIFFKIIIPVSIPVIATIALFNAVFQWNAWFDTMIYGGRKLMTLQMQLVEIIKDADQVRRLMSSGSTIAAALAKLGYKPNIEAIKATAMMITAIPIVMIYPFLQKHFVKGIMIGSLKG